MIENYHKWYSQWIGEDFEMLVFGDRGIPLVLFPQKNTRYFDYKDFGVIESLAHFIDEGILMVYCPDSFDSKSWLNRAISPQDRVEKYEKFEQAILHDIIGFANYETEEEKIIFSGFDFGAYYALNMAFKYPEHVRGLLTIGGNYEIKDMLEGHFEEQVYYDSPLDYLFGLNEDNYLKQFKKIKMVLASGTPDPSFGQNKYVSKLLFEKGINHLFDVYPHKLNTYDDCKQILNSNLHYFF